MSQVRKMTGTSWQIEKHYETNAYARNCVNCTYFQEEGRMCRKHNEHISFSFARNCKYFKNENGPIPDDYNKEENDDFIKPVIKRENAVSNMFLIHTKKRWNSYYVKNKKKIIISCRGIDSNLLEEMKKTNYIICYDGFAVYRIKVQFISLTNNCLVFHNSRVYGFHTPGFMRLSNSKTKVVVNDRYYNSVLFVREKIDG